MKLPEIKMKKPRLAISCFTLFLSIYHIQDLCIYSSQIKYTEKMLKQSSLLAEQMLCLSGTYKGHFK